MLVPKTTFFRVAAVFSLLLAMLIFVPLIHAATFTVTNTSNTGAGSLRQAILDANASAGADTIVFDSSFNTPQTITLATVLTINGVNDTLTITGPGEGLLTISGNNVTQVFSISAGETASISGMTITGAINGAVANSGTLTFSNSTFTANTDASGGGGITNGLTLTVVNCTFSNNTNTAPGVNGAGGGAIRNTATATITNSTFSGNTTGAAEGGAISHGGGTMTITGSSFTGNATTVIGQDSDGGAIAIQGGAQLTINNSTFTGNSTIQLGGAIYYQPNAAGAFLVINDSTISNNISDSDNNGTGAGGGLLLTGTGSVTITGSTISGNTAQGVVGDGGGINTSTVTNITNSTISGNTAGRSGGGIYASGVSTAIVTIESSTIVNNTAVTTGGGVRRASVSNPVNLHNTIVANNTDDGTAPDVQGTVVSQGYNLIEDTTGASITGDLTGNITGLDPNLGPLADNTGPTFTHALLPGSPAMEAADPVNFPATDQRGVPRPLNGDMSGSTLPDIGSFEQYVTTAAPVIVSGRVTVEGQGVKRAVVTLTSMSGEAFATRTNKRGYFQFNEVPAGESYVLTVSANKMRFEPQLIDTNSDATGILVIGEKKQPGRNAGVVTASPASHPAEHKFAARNSAAD